jgi:hypothetical protein
MTRKRIADQEPAVPVEGAVTPVKAAAKKAPAAKKPRAPRASTTAVTHRHKKSATSESQVASTPSENAAVSNVGDGAAAEAPRATMGAPTHHDIAQLAYSLWAERGYQGGSPEDDWYTAERMLRAQRNEA